ncbi:MAG: hypothetical protein APR56_10210 [Methanosaeta sp. SDB]|nr:MAG: hypothetical protein APR56_10210 [Methanosaeta sp. SDB]
MFPELSLFRLAAMTVAAIGLLIPAGPAQAEGPSPEPIARTRDLGEMGDVDAFLTDVVPDWPGWSRRWWTDKELWGNQGYIIGGPRGRLQEAGLIEVGLSEEIDIQLESPAEPEPPLEKVDLDLAGEKPTTHRVVKGECLWYIAGYDHIYGNPLQWPLIYKANTDRIKNPDLIYPGQVFIIPRD